MSSKITHVDKTPAYRELWTNLDRTSTPRSIIVEVKLVEKAIVAHEKDVCKALREFWKKNGFFYIRNQQGLGSKRGTADYTVVKNGYTFFVEAKATNGKQSPYQELFQEELERAHGGYMLVHSLEEFMELWKERGNG